MRWLLLLCLAGCSPFVEYTHVLQPNVRDSGLDLACGGVAAHRGNLEVSGALCEDIGTRPSDIHEEGTYVKGSVRYSW